MFIFFLCANGLRLDDEAESSNQYIKKGKRGIFKSQTGRKTYSRIFCMNVKKLKLYKNKKKNSLSTKSMNILNCNFNWEKISCLNEVVE